MAHHDPALDSLLDLHGQVLVIDEVGCWVRFIVHRVPVTPEKPHGLDYSLTLHGPEGSRWAGFDNAHQVEGKRRTTLDHKHRLRTIRPYDYRDAASLVADFWAEVEAVMHEKGLWQ